MNHLRPFVASALLGTLLFALPFETLAFPAPASSIGQIRAGIDTSKTVIGTLPTVPTIDTAANAKDEGIEIFGINTGISWNQLALQAAKIVISQVVDATVNWINSGFNGSPAYVTDPLGYFGNLANGIIGDAINDSSIGFLCKPIQEPDWVKRSLIAHYGGTGSPQYNPQCTLTGIQGNIENFYNNFNVGGWGAFAELTQVPGNNPYGSYIDAQNEIDARIAAVVNSQTQLLNWGQGFKSADGTPGATLKAHLDATLPANNFLSQITTADQFDKILSALENGLVQRFAFDQNGLLGKASRTSSSGSGNNPQSLVSCRALTDSASAGDKVTWTVTTNFQGISTFTWHGKDEDIKSAYDPSQNATGTTAVISYAKPGPKTASVTASMTEVDDLGNLLPDTQKTVTYDCSNAVQVAAYPPLTVTCTANTQTANSSNLSDPSTWVTWKVDITGGSGQIDILKWDGDQSLFAHTDKSKVWPDSLKSDSNDIYDPALKDWNWQVNVPLHITHLFNLFDQTPSPKNSGTIPVLETITRTKDASGVNHIEAVVTRPYLTNDIVTVNANITVIDHDTNLKPYTNQQCGNSVTIIKK